tara:strand:- start:333 stop:458 length:126 start_codon:yes stop_codon:yes gene_type:complete
MRENHQKTITAKKLLYFEIRQEEQSGDARRLRPEIREESIF